MKYLVHIIFVLMLGSCSMKKYCSERFPPSTITRDSISYIENTIVRDTTIFVPIPFEQVKDSVDIDTVSGFTYSTLTTSFAWSYATIINGKLYHYLQQKDSLIAKLIAGAIRQHSRVEYKDRVKEKLVEVNKLTKFQIIQMGAAWILAAIFVLMLLWKRIFSYAGWALKLLKKRKPP